MGHMTLITGGERRRRWSDADRARILAAISEPGAIVAEVARREDICTGLIYQWRRAARRQQSAAACGFSPVIIETTPPLPSRTAPACGSGVVEVELKDVRVRIAADAPAAVIAATLKALRP